MEKIEAITRAVRRASVRAMQRLQERMWVLVGSSAEMLLPDLAREIDEGRGSGRALKLKRVIVRSRLWRAERSGDPAAIEQALLDRWRSDVDDGFYATFIKRFDRWFYGPHYCLINALADVVAANPGFARLVEVGCGNGRALSHLAQRLPRLQEFVGLDINARIIARNVEAYGDCPRLSFIHGDARECLAKEIRDGTIFFSYGGVLEYFREAEVALILGRLGRCRDSAVALVEPVDRRHDLVRDAGSHIHGLERSFSHNHLALLAAAEFNIRYTKELTTDGIRWMMIVATRSPPMAPAES